MKNKFILCLFLAAGFSAFAQIGINMPDPKATLDVTATKKDGTTPEGIIAPRLSGDALFTASGTQYGAAQDGAIVYVISSVSPGNDTGQTININAPGYYYFDATADQWKKIGVESTIYNSDGTLSNARTMDMNSSTLGFMNGRVGIGTNTPHPSAILEIKNTTHGFLPPRMTKAQMDAIVNPSLGLVIYCTDCFAGNTGCVMVNDSNNESIPKWGSLCSSNASGPNVLTLECTNATVTGALYAGVSASGVSSSVPYTGGNGGMYHAENFNSTGVAGLIASLSGGTLNTGNGSLVFNIIGTPSVAGTATFTISVAGQTCSFNIPVSTLSASVGALGCGTAVLSPATPTQGTAYSGTLTVPYTAGNGGAYPQISFTQNGLTFTLPSGTLVAGNGNLIYNVIGTPSNPGAMNIPVSFGAASCNVSTTVAIGTTVVMGGNPQAWTRHNLGADTSLDPDVPVQGIHGNYYQWGKLGAVATAYTPAGPIGGWNTTLAPIGAWVDASKTANDPCPTGFRVPTRTQWQNLINNNSISRIGTFVDSATNFDSALVLTSGSNKLTLPAAGSRTYNSVDASLNGSLNKRGFGGGYWSSTQNTDQNSYQMVFTSSVQALQITQQLHGYSLRCIAE